MKILSITICVLLLLVVSLPCTAGQNEKAAPPALTWRDAETKSVLFTSDDIISFDWDKQVFLMNRDATLDFLAWRPPHGHQARLVVQDSNGDIYNAHWFSVMSSEVVFEPAYEPLSPNPFFSIAYGSPAGKGPRTGETDPRFAPRLKAGLEKAGVLHPIDLNRQYVGLIIQTTGHMWKNVGEDMNIRVEYFENTFHLGGKARAHIFFAGGEKTRKQIDSFALNITFVANDGTFRSVIAMKPFPVSETEDGIHVCKFAPWEPGEGSDKEAKLGTGYIYLSILLQKQDKTMYRLDFPESRVLIGGRIQTEPTDSLFKK
jgi:hypothetical protein